MRGRNDPQNAFWCRIDLEGMVPDDHPLREIKRRADAALAAMSADFDRVYSRRGRPGVPPERLLKAIVLQQLYSVRSERALCERIRFDLLFRWFLDMQPDEDAFDPTTFTHNRARLERGGLCGAFLDRVVSQARAEGLVSDDHFSVDGTLVASRASVSSLERIGDDDDDGDGGGGGGSGGAPRGLRKGERLSNATHRSTTDPEARIARHTRAGSARLSHSAHVLMENRSGLAVAVSVAEANGTAERECALEMVRRARRRHGVMVRTLGADKGYDAGDFLLELADSGIEPHVPLQRLSRRPKRRTRDWELRTAMDARREEPGPRESQRRRKRIESIFAWAKRVALLGRSSHFERWKLKQQVEIGAATHNLVRMSGLRRAA
jgi:transposase